MPLMSSVVSYPERGPYGKSSWRGNCTGYLVKDFLESFHPANSGLFVDPSEGSGTSRDVCAELGVRYQGFDLHSGFNLLKDRLVEAAGEEAETAYWHPPYGNLIEYSGNVWGEPHPDDLSRCDSVGDFLEKSQLALMNIYEAVRAGGHYGVLIGNMRKQGKFYNLASMYERLCLGNQVQQVIKLQHNTLSSRKHYSGTFVPISHETLMIFEKPQSVACAVTIAIDRERRMQMKSSMTWRNIVRLAAMGKGQMPLKDLYGGVFEKVSQLAPHLLKRNKHIEAKVRQIVQKDEAFVSEMRGRWGLAA